LVNKNNELKEKLKVYVNLVDKLVPKSQYPSDLFTKLLASSKSLMESTSGSSLPGATSSYSTVSIKKATQNKAESKQNTVEKENNLKRANVTDPLKSSDSNLKHAQPQQQQNHKTSAKETILNNININAWLGPFKINKTSHLLPIVRLEQ
jgi:hypothetical protein